MRFLIDTNIIIYSLKNAGYVKDNFLKYKDDEMSLSVISYGELVFGAKKSGSVEKNLKTVEYIKSIFTLVDVTSDVMDVFGEIKAKIQETGRIIDDMDLLIASTAISENMILVTHNTKHFEKIPNLQIQDWF